MGAHKLLEQAKRLKSDRRGNFAIIAAGAIPAIIFGVGVALDTSLMASTKYRLQNAADAGATAAASALASNTELTLSEAESLAVNYVKVAMDGAYASVSDDCISADAAETEESGTATSFDVTVNVCANYSLSGFTRVFGDDADKINVVSVAHSATESQKALSMYLVLDRSGSMGEDTDTVASTTTYTCGNNGTYYGRSRGRNYGRGSSTCTSSTYITKIEALILAGEELLTEIAEADPDEEYARLGAVAYSSYMYTPEDLDWGVGDVWDYIEALSASGGTDSSYAMKEAYEELTDGTEETVHEAMNGQTPNKFIVFMTDGDNNYSSADTATKQWCDAAKSADVEIYTVAFMVDSGSDAETLLSYCATDSSHYFDADSAEEMIAAFKTIGEQAAERMTILTQ